MPNQLMIILLAVYILHSSEATFQLPPGLSWASTVTLSSQQPPPHTSHDTSEASLRAKLRASQVGHHSPRKWNLKADKLLKKLGKFWDPFWMSVSKPSDFLNMTSTSAKINAEFSWVQNMDISDLTISLKAIFRDCQKGSCVRTGAPDTNKNSTTRDDTTMAAFSSINGTTANTSTHEELYRNATEGSADSTLSRAVNPGEDEEVVIDVLGAVKNWMMEQTTCRVHHIWEDLGALFWPRYIRRGFCSDKSIPMNLRDRVPPSLFKSSGGECSWPPGMMCVPGKEKRLKILSWRCGPRGSTRHQKRGSSKRDRRSSATFTPRTPLTKESSTSSKRLPVSGELALQPNNTSAVSGITMPNEFQLPPGAVVRGFADNGENTGPVDVQSILKKFDKSSRSGFDLGQVKKIKVDTSQGELLDKLLLAATINNPLVKGRPGRRRPGMPQLRDNDTRRRPARKGRRMKPRTRCVWVKVNYLTVDDCFCSC